MGMFELWPTPGYTKLPFVVENQYEACLDTMQGSDCKRQHVLGRQYCIRVFALRSACLRHDVSRFDSEGSSKLELMMLVWMPCRKLIYPLNYSCSGQIRPQ